MNEPLACCLGYLLLVSPSFYWIILDINTVRRSCSGIKLNKKSIVYENETEQQTLILSKNEIIVNSKKPDSNNQLSSHMDTKMENVLKFSNIMSWFGLMVISYILVRSSVNYLNWKRTFKYIASDCQDIMELCIRSFLIYVLGNIANRFGQHDTKKSFICYVLYFLVTYTVTYQSCPNIEIGGEGITNVVSVVLCVPFFILVTYILVRNCHVAYNRSMITRTLYFGGIIMFGFIQGIMITYASKYIRIHIHHHYYALVMALICRSSDKASYVAQACLIAVFIHGITVFGCEDLFQWQNVNQEYFKDKCQDWICPAWKCILPKHDTFNVQH